MIILLRKQNYIYIIQFDDQHHHQYVQSYDTIKWLHGNDYELQFYTMKKYNLGYKQGPFVWKHPN